MPGGHNNEVITTHMFVRADAAGWQSHSELHIDSHLSRLSAPTWEELQNEMWWQEQLQQENIFSADGTVLMMMADPPFQGCNQCEITLVIKIDVYLLVWDW